LTASPWPFAYRVLRFRAIPKIAMAAISGTTAKNPGPSRGEIVMKQLAVWVAALGLSLIGTRTADAQSMTLTSADLKEGATVANEQVFKSFGCSGNNVSPALSWSGAPGSTKSFAVTMYDPDAPTGSGWWHWVVFNIPPA
jgi:hypothetical protein